MLEVRPASINNAKDLGEIHVSSWKVAYKGIVPDKVLDNMTVGKREEYFKNAILNSSEENFIIFNEDIALGFICLGRCRDNDRSEIYGEIGGIYLHPKYYRQGIGSKLITWGINELTKRNYKKITLWVLEENIGARAFYEKFGFKHDGTIKEINIGKKLNEYRYEKTLY